LFFTKSNLYPKVIRVPSLSEYDETLYSIPFHIYLLKRKKTTKSDIPARKAQNKGLAKAGKQLILIKHQITNGINQLNTKEKKRKEEKRGKKKKKQVITLHKKRGNYGNR